MNQKPIILVVGATGAQGGSVANALLQEGKFAVRILTRKPRSERALQLKKRGAEVFQGDLEQPESLQKALVGCYGVFGVTNFWEHFEHEYRQGIHLIQAVQKAGIRHFVLSTADDYQAQSNGDLPVLQRDIKAALESCTKRLGLPATFVHLSFYYENFIGDFPLQYHPDGTCSFSCPQGDTPMAMVSVSDLGKVVASIFDHPDAYIGRVVGVVGDDRSCTEYAAILSKVLGREVRYEYVTRDQYAASGAPGALEMANLFEVQRLYFTQHRLQLIESYCLNPALQTFEKWLIRNREKLLGKAQPEPELVAA